LLHKSAVFGVYADDMRLLCLLAVLLFAQQIFGQQTPFTPAPHVLQFYCEVVKPGKAQFVAQIERQSVANQVTLNTPHSYLTISATSGPDGLLCWINGYDSYAELDQLTATIVNNMPDLARLFADIPQQKADLVINPRVAFARLREDLSYGRGRTGAHTRFFVISTVRVRPGHGSDFTELRRVVRGGHERARAADNLSVYEVESGMPDGTFLVFSPAASLDEAGAISQFHGRGLENTLTDQARAKLRELTGAAILRSETTMFTVDPSISLPAREWIDSDPEFWRGNPVFSRR
jgi:hypothetical protein